MKKVPISLQDLRRSLYVKAKAEPLWRFWGLPALLCDSLHLFMLLVAEPNGMLYGSRHYAPPMKKGFGAEFPNTG
jgi:hypothetical protein